MTVIEKKGNLKNYYNDFLFLEATNTKETTKREYHGIIKVESEKGKKTLITTNGRSLHIIEYNDKSAPPLKNGYYSINKKTDTFIIDNHSLETYPDYKAVIPAGNIKCIDDYLLTDDKKFDTHTYNGLIYILNYLGFKVNYKYIEPLRALNLKWDIYLKHGAKSVLLKSGDYTSVIYLMDTSEIDLIITRAIQKLNENNEVANNE